eukprot:CAMPEP_0198328470 /NCGR_PEP_ID=MMETSP1450-20131203/15509_1 /TAXON_ID=753684 ORGANISM="Madagascaria erythrocladiodes, Strain CCMP3234" /NCGR_SAMPLE_ID=MMETSP1450 /ASSEMBLY_ACC=CAM_ASM_001115 /LENGTH=132 /DNA_ID=CAMNT_0044032609 /DNA_START=102 /DNA_END=500 /DNA_ORIENTATION=-
MPHGRRPFDQRRTASVFPEVTYSSAQTLSTESDFDCSLTALGRQNSASDFVTDFEGVRTESALAVEFARLTSKTTRVDSESSGNASEESVETNLPTAKNALVFGGLVQMIQFRKAKRLAERRRKHQMLRRVL